MIQKRVVIVGGTSGIGIEAVKRFREKGWIVGVAGRNKEVLDQLSSEYGEGVVCQVIDVRDEKAGGQLIQLSDAIGGMDVFLLSSGIGSSNMELDQSIEMATVETNALGFVRLIDAAYHYFKQMGGGHIAAITSVAGTKGLGSAPAYSATKRFQNHYLDCLAQLSRMTDSKIKITDIRPGFVNTPLLKKKKYPLLMEAKPVSEALVNAIIKEKRVVVIDWRYRLLVAVWRRIPRWVWERLAISNN